MPQIVIYLRVTKCVLFKSQPKIFEEQNLKPAFLLFPRDPMELMLMEQQLLRSPLRLYASGPGSVGGDEEAEKRAAWARTPPALQLLALGGRAWPAAWPQPLGLPPDLWLQKPPTPLRYCPYPQPAHPSAPPTRPDHAPSPRHPL